MNVVPSPAEEALLGISVTRLAVLSFFTAGLYDLYWFYKNWKALALEDASIKHPVWRTCFAIFYCYPLFKQLRKRAVAAGYKKRFPAGLIATIYITLALLENTANRPIGSHNTMIAINFVPFVSFIPLLVVQPALCYLSRRQNPHKHYKLAGGELAIVVIGILLTAVSLTAYLTSN